MESKAKNRVLFLPFEHIGGHLHQSLSGRAGIMTGVNLLDFVFVPNDFMNFLIQFGHSSNQIEVRQAFA
jgi:hypothetical protein